MRRRYIKYPHLYLYLYLSVCVCVQCTRSCGGGVQFRSVSCVGGRVCIPSDKPTEDQACNHDVGCDVTDDVISDVTQPDYNDTEVTTVKTSSVMPSSAATPQTMTTTAATTTTTTTSTAATTTTSRATTTTYRPSTSYRWMALFWNQVLIYFQSL